MAKLLLFFIVLFSTLFSTSAAFSNETLASKDLTKSTSAPPFFNANKTAFVTTISVAALTAASVFGAVNAARTANTFGIISYTALSLVGAAVSIAAITSWVSFGDKQATTDAGTYLQKTGEHAAYGIAGMAAFTTQILVQAVISGLAQGTSRVISRSISGEDQTIRIVR